MASSAPSFVGTSPTTAALRLYSTRPGKSEQQNELLLTSPESDCDDCSSPDELSVSDEARAILGNQAISDAAKIGLSKAELEQLAELKERDQEVRSHEQAHFTAAGQYATGGPSYSTVQGPDGRHYAVEGEVPIDISPVADDPEATIEKARTIRRAALAPAHPSSQDQAIAAKAAQLEAQAQQELRDEQSESFIEKTADNSDASETNTTSATNESASSTDAANIESGIASVAPTSESQSPRSTAQVTAVTQAATPDAINSASSKPPQPTAVAHQIVSAYSHADTSRNLDVRI